MLTLHFTESDQHQLHHERFHYPEPRVQLKMEVLYLKSQGLTHAEIARLARVSERTISRYLNDYATAGLEALKRPGAGGSTSDLAAQELSLKDHFAQHPAHTIKQAQADIERLTGIRRGATQVRAFLLRLGFKRRCAMRVPKHAQDPDKQREQRVFHDDKLQPQLDQAEAGQRQVYFVDAAHFVFGAFVGYLWCLTRRVLPTPSGRQRLNVLGALNFVTKQMVTVTNQTYITATTVAELIQLLVAQNPGIPITLVLDNARYQRCRLVQNRAASLGVQLEFLPSYSPNLNLIERVWKFVKQECLSSRHYGSFVEFQASILTCLDELGTKHRGAMTTLITRNFQLFDDQTLSAA
jgi:transposase